jgi:hypothetical protein
MNEQNLIFEKALKTYGATAQIKVLMEECAELCYALVTDSSEEEIFSEIVDVSIMINQFKYLISTVENDPHIFLRIENENDKILDEEYDDRTIEKTIEIFSKLSFMINHYDRGKISVNDLCESIVSADNRITFLISDSDELRESGESGIKIYNKLYKEKFDRLKQRLEKD